jgi:glucose-1-phosphate cytidylyltransferase
MIKTVILAGGLGTRISEETKKIPKPMVKVGGLPIIHHIIKIYESYGYGDFIICGGYKYNLIKNYFKKAKLKSKVLVVNTGMNTMTGGRILKIKNILKNDKKFFLTYGDGVSNININKVLKLHNQKKKLLTLTAVQPNLKYGVVKFSKNKLSIEKFEEKPKKHFISGGFFVVSTEIFKYISGPKSIFEFNCLPKLAKQKQIIGYKHRGFWHSLDTMKDKINLNKIWNKGNAPWIK